MEALPKLGLHSDFSSVPPFHCCRPRCMKSNGTMVMNSTKKYDQSSAMHFAACKKLRISFTLVFVVRMEVKQNSRCREPLHSSQREIKSNGCYKGCAFARECRIQHEFRISECWIWRMVLMHSLAWLFCAPIGSEVDMSSKPWARSRMDFAISLDCTRIR